MPLTMGNSGRYADNAGRVRFSQWRRETGVRIADLALLLETSPHTVAQWVSGLTRPQGPNLIAVEELTGIPATDWFTDKEKRQLETKLERIRGVKKARRRKLTHVERIADCLSGEVA